MIKINIINDYNSTLSFKSNYINKYVHKIFKDEKKYIHSLSIILTNRDYLSMLKKKYFNLDHFTDVIVFNLENKDEDIEGEIYISIDDILENSKTYKASFDDEFKRVLIHGVLHLIGYEDIENKDIKIMRGLEEKYLLNFNEEIIYLEC